MGNIWFFVFIYAIWLIATIAYCQARIVSGENEIKKQQRKALADMMKEDEKNGMYESK